MQSTMTLLERALQLEPLPFWHRELKLERTTLHKARERGHLSPAIAGVMAEKLGENVEKWIVIAALESERESACKKHLLKKIAKW